MLSSSLGAAVSGNIQPAIPLQKNENNEEFAQPAQDATEQAAVEESTAPAVPPTNGVSISLEAVTALQQADETVASDNQTDNLQLNQAVAADIRDSAEISGDEDPVVEAEGSEAQESRQTASTELPVGEETDSAGRSVRNPLDLQI